MQGILSSEKLEQLIWLRRHLHKHPELSGREKQTAATLSDFLKQYQPDELHIDLAGHGMAAIYDSGKQGPVICFRADMDALPIEEINTFEYRSAKPGVSHKCGHDGHMAILTGLAIVLADNRPKQGKVMLLFQPAEETGEGAEKILQQTFFSKLQPHWVFALHNLPGFRKNAIIFKEGSFAAASKGMIVHLEGRSSHAAHPEQGNSPVHMMTRLIEQLTELPDKQNTWQDFVLLTIIHAKLGDVAFGTNPGNASVMATLRTFSNDDMQLLTQLAEERVRELAHDHGIRASVSYTEVFPATVNHPAAGNFIKNAAQQTGYPLVELKEPFRWSEDFGHFTQKFQGALFGLGAGEQQPGLHNPDYDFPDELIPAGVEIFYNITEQILT